MGQRSLRHEGAADSRATAASVRIFSGDFSTAARGETTVDPKPTLAPVLLP
jgi:hypothetical protein